MGYLTPCDILGYLTVVPNDPKSHSALVFDRLLNLSLSLKKKTLFVIILLIDSISSSFG